MGSNGGEVATEDAHWTPPGVPRSRARNCPIKLEPVDPERLRQLIFGDHVAGGSIDAFVQLARLAEAAPI